MDEVFFRIRVPTPSPALAFWSAWARAGDPLPEVNPQDTQESLGQNPLFVYYERFGPHHAARGQPPGTALDLAGILAAGLEASG
jgi:hypothetical protein